MKNKVIKILTLVLTLIFLQTCFSYATVNKAELIATGILKYQNGEVVIKDPYSYGRNGLPWAKGKKGIENALGGYTKFESNGIIYEYTGDWVYEDGSKVDFPDNKLTLLPKDGEDEYYTVVISPVYSETLVKFLEFYYTDNVSTGSGSWSNKSSFKTFTHTFKQPDDAKHYKFIEWKDEETGKTYQEGDTYSIPITDIKVGETKVVQINAYWQPSITLNYYDEDGSLLLSDEQFTEVAVDNEGPNKEGKEFLGWYVDDTEVTGNVYEAPGITTEKINRAEVNVQAKYKEIPVKPEKPEKPEKPDKTNSSEEDDKTTTKTKTIVKKYYNEKTIIKRFTTKPTIINNKYITKNTYVINDEKVDKLEEEVEELEDGMPPLAVRRGIKRQWALLNLLFTLLITVMAAFVIVKYNRKKDQDQRDYQTKHIHRILSFVMALLSIVIFFLTTNFSYPMGWFDQWTILFFIFFVDQLVLTILNYRMFKARQES